MNSKESKRDKKPWSPELGSEVVAPRASFIVALRLRSQELENLRPFGWFGASLPELQQLGHQEQIP